MNPLAVSGGLGKAFDPLWRNRKPFRDANLPANQFFQRLQIVDNEGCHRFLPIQVAALHRRLIIKISPTLMFLPYFYFWSVPIWRSIRGVLHRVRRLTAMREHRPGASQKSIL